jgi:hypothetical protein
MECAINPFILFSLLLTNVTSGSIKLPLAALNQFFQDILDSSKLNRLNILFISSFMA